MKLGKKFIVRVAKEVKRERGKATQYEIHIAIEEKLGRTLTPAEKARVTRILQDELGIKEIKREDWYRIYIF